MLYTRVRLKEWGNSWDMHHEAEGALILGIPNPTPPLRPLSEVFNQSNALVELNFFFSRWYPEGTIRYHREEKGKIEMPMGAGFPIFKMPHPVQREKFCAPIH